MFFKNIPILFLFLISIILSLIGQYQAVIIFINTAALFFFITKRRYVLILYIIFLPLNGIFPKTLNLFGIINIDIIINLLALVVLFQYKNVETRLSFHQKIPIMFIYTILFYFIYTDLKQAYFHVGGFDLGTAIPRIIYFILKYIPLALFIKNIQNQIFKNIFEFGSQFAIILLVLSSIFTPTLFQLGFKVSGTEDVSETLFRYSGFMGSGDANSLGSFLVIVIGYYFSRIEQGESKNIYYFIIFISLIGVFITASRTAISGLIIITLIFNLRNFNRKYFIYLSIVIVLIFYSIKPLVFSALSRFQDYESQLTTKPHAGRLSKWLIYGQDMMNNPSILIYGTKRGVLETSKYATSSFIAAHNVYIQMVHNSGLVPFIIIMSLYFKYFIYLRRSRNKYNSFYYILPFLFIFMFVSDFGAMHYFVIYLSLNRVKNSRSVLFINRVKNYNKFY